MLIVAYIVILMGKNKKAVKNISIAYFVAFLVAALPLFFLFLRKQIEYQYERENFLKAMTFDGNFFTDIYKKFFDVVKWNLFSYYGDQAIIFFILFFIITLIIALIFSKKEYIKVLAIINLFTWFLYYFAVKTGLYAYGEFGNRYNLFFLPLWIITIFCFGIEIYDFLINVIDGKGKHIAYYYIGICMCSIACFMFMGWTSKLQERWTKSNMRDVVDSWIAVGAENSNTIVYYGADPEFAYYIRQYDDYSYEIENNVNYMYWYRDKTIDEYTEYINSVYGTVWPNEIYIIGSHTHEDFDMLISALTNNGYERTDLYNKFGASLIRCRWPV